MRIRGVSLNEPLVPSFLLLQYCALTSSLISLLFAAEDIVCDNPEQLQSLFQSVEVGFEDLSMNLKQKKKGVADRVILDGSIRGVAKPGRMLAIMVCKQLHQ